MRIPATMMSPHAFACEAETNGAAGTKTFEDLSKEPANFSESVLFDARDTETPCKFQYSFTSQTSRDNQTKAVKSRTECQKGGSGNSKCAYSFGKLERLDADLIAGYWRRHKGRKKSRSGYERIVDIRRGGWKM